jgi:hypothetical protein
MSVIARAPEPPRAKLSRKLARLGPREVASLLRGLRQLVDLVEVERIESTLSSEDSRARGKHPSNGA